MQSCLIVLQHDTVATALMQMEFLSCVETLQGLVSSAWWSRFVAQKREHDPCTCNSTSCIGFIPDSSFEDFLQALPDRECRYAVYDYDYRVDTQDYSKICFILWWANKTHVSFLWLHEIVHVRASRSSTCSSTACCCHLRQSCTSQHISGLPTKPKREKRCWSPRAKTHWRRNSEILSGASSKLQTKEIWTKRKLEENASQENKSTPMFPFGSPNRTAPMLWHLWRVTRWRDVQQLGRFFRSMSLPWSRDSTATAPNVWIDLAFSQFSLYNISWSRISSKSHSIEWICAQRCKFTSTLSRVHVCVHYEYNTRTVFQIQARFVILWFLSFQSRLKPEWSNVQSSSKSVFNVFLPSRPSTVTKLKFLLFFSFLAIYCTKFPHW